ncbi:carboxylating nicotinate-nucleotide diphosphorylase [Chromobacterium sp. IIBBL 290-4]|uniref:carboxylating nicotinate-nucleotide diphosphorylase n=1 Tax=Chromobacterium sp. IIBBL 290-4 TaxID=2953890 RepID=UPI0020B8655A|nr:carboxylating nicotinate-nucleotide diphosphorylase [Chromobacterium sp. IIBBL 290-4]UTH74513.1 carboxylating nicotinate-nucleotide diphosphorylase [Chromobacterium sp. IIBBL 290-4]
MPRLPAFHLIAQQVSQALAEDIGACDWTARLIAEDKLGSARVIAREEAVICGQAWFEESFRQVDARCQVEWQVKEGERVAAGQELCRIHGPARALLTAERTGLNFLQLLSAVASETRRYVDAAAGHRARILDTRKTLPGLRLAQKYAVTVGGGDNQRVGLYDGILIKENHIMAAGGVAQAMRQALQDLPHGVTLQIEVETLAQLEEALRSGAKLVLLDNMSTEQMRAAVELTAGRAELEASGGIDMDTVRAIAATGVDRISVGKLTKDIRAVDLSMRFAW